MVNTDSLGDTPRRPTRNPEDREKQELLTRTIFPRILEHGKFFREGLASEFYDLKYSQGMDRVSRQYRDQLPISLNNLTHTVTFGYWLFGKQSVGVIQAVNLTENPYGETSTGRPFVQKRIGLIDPKTLLDLYASGIRPLSSMLVNAYPNEKEYLLQKYDSVPGQTDEPWRLETRVKPLWEIHQDKKYRKLAIRATEAVLAKRQARIRNPVVLEHKGELTLHHLSSFIDTVNVLLKAIDPGIITISAINAASMDNYSNVDLVIKDTTIPPTTEIYPSYIVNHNDNDEEVLPGHYSTPPFKQTGAVPAIYDKLHESVDNWVKNHESVFKRD